LYSQQTHLILELIQNADDNSYPDGVLPTLRLELFADRVVVSVVVDGDRVVASVVVDGDSVVASAVVDGDRVVVSVRQVLQLVQIDATPADLSLPTFCTCPPPYQVLNNEVGFSANNLRALCDVGNSTKSKGSDAANNAQQQQQQQQQQHAQQKQQFTGEKGIGFKSVFQLTDNPQIFSNGFRFEFRAKDPTGLGYILPHWVADTAEGAVEADSHRRPKDTRQKRPKGGNRRRKQKSEVKAAVAACADGAVGEGESTATGGGTSAAGTIAAGASAVGTSNATAAFGDVAVGDVSPLSAALVPAPAWATCIRLKLKDELLGRKNQQQWRAIASEMLTGLETSVMLFLHRLDAIAGDYCM
jgi:hypothetical protein